MNTEKPSTDMGPAAEHARLLDLLADDELQIPDLHLLGSLEPPLEAKAVECKGQAESSAAGESRRNKSNPGQIAAVQRNCMGRAAVLVGQGQQAQLPELQQYYKASTTAFDHASRANGSTMPQAAIQVHQHFTQNGIQQVHGITNPWGTESSLGEISKRLLGAQNNEYPADRFSTHYGAATRTASNPYVSSLSLDNFLLHQPSFSPPNAESQQFFNLFHGGGRRHVGGDLGDGLQAGWERAPQGGYRTTGGSYLGHSQQPLLEGAPAVAGFDVGMQPLVDAHIPPPRSRSAYIGLGYNSLVRRSASHDHHLARYLPNTAQNDTASAWDLARAGRAQDFLDFQSERPRSYGHIIGEARVGAGSGNALGGLLHSQAIARRAGRQQSSSQLTVSQLFELKGPPPGPFTGRPLLEASRQQESPHFGTVQPLLTPNLLSSCQPLVGLHTRRAPVLADPTVGRQPSRQQLEHLMAAHSSLPQSGGLDEQPIQQPRSSLAPRWPKTSAAPILPSSASHNPLDESPLFAMLPNEGMSNGGQPSTTASMNRLTTQSILAGGFMPVSLPLLTVSSESLADSHKSKQQKLMTHPEMTASGRNAAAATAAEPDVDPDLPVADLPVLDSAAANMPDRPVHHEGFPSPPPLCMLASLSPAASPGSFDGPSSPLRKKVALSADAPGKTAAQPACSGAHKTPAEGMEKGSGMEHAKSAQTAAAKERLSVHEQEALCAEMYRAAGLSGENEDAGSLIAEQGIKLDANINRICRLPSPISAVDVLLVAFSVLGKPARQDASIEELYSVCARWRAAAYGSQEPKRKVVQKCAGDCYTVGWPGLKFTKLLGSRDEAAAKAEMTRVLRSSEAFEEVTREAGEPCLKVWRTRSIVEDHSPIANSPSGMDALAAGCFSRAALVGRVEQLCLINDSICGMEGGQALLPATEPGLLEPAG